MVLVEDLKRAVDPLASATPHVQEVHGIDSHVQEVHSMVLVEDLKRAVDPPASATHLQTPYFVSSPTSPVQPVHVQEVHRMDLVEDLKRSVDPPASATHLQAFVSTSTYSVQPVKYKQHICRVQLVY